MHFGKDVGTFVRPEASTDLLFDLDLSDTLFAGIIVIGYGLFPKEGKDIQKLWRNLSKKATNAPSGPNNSKNGGYKPVLSPDLIEIKDFSLEEYFSIKIVA